MIKKDSKYAKNVRKEKGIKDKARSSLKRTLQKLKTEKS